MPYAALSETGSTIWNTSNTIATGWTMASDEYPAEVAAYLILGNENSVHAAATFDLVDSDISNNIALGSKLALGPGENRNVNLSGAGNAWFAGKTLLFRRLTQSNGNGYYTGIHISAGSGVSYNPGYIARTITINSATGGAVTTASTSLIRGAQTTLTVDPDPGWRLKTMGGTAGAITYNNGSITFTMSTPAVDVTITPVFEPILFENQNLTVTQNDLTIKVTKSGASFREPIHQTGAYVSGGATYYLRRTCLSLPMSDDNHLLGWLPYDEYTFSGDTITITEAESDTGAVFSYELYAKYGNTWYFGAKTVMRTKPIHQSVAYYNGSNWIECIASYYTGSTWVETYLSYYSGGWIDIDADDYFAIELE